MFRTSQQYRTFLTVLMTYTLDLVGYSIVFPVLAPLLLNPNLQFFAPDVPEMTRTSILGFLFAIFGVAQFIGAPFAGALADHYGRFKVFVGTIGLSILGYLLMAFSIYIESITLLFLGRFVTGFCSGNYSLAQSTTADLTDIKHRSKAFGILLSVGGLGFVAGPWIGGKLANPDWLHGSAAFIFAAAAALVNLIIVFFFFVETFHRKEKHAKFKVFGFISDIRVVFKKKILRNMLICNLFFSIGWGFLLIGSPIFLVQRFNLSSTLIGDMFAYMGMMWFFVSMVLNKELASKFSLRALILAGSLIATLGVAWYVATNNLWSYWLIIPFTTLGGALAWVNIGAALSIKTPATMQGRSLGAGASLWSIGQITAPLLVGVLAGWDLYLPLSFGAFFLFVLFIYLLFTTKQSEFSISP